MAPMPVARLLHINSDSCWLLKYSDPALPLNSFNILVDPWLRGSQHDFSPLFSRQVHLSKPAYSSIKNIDDVERVDAILISHEFTDHCHKETLKTIARKVPIFAGTPQAQARLKKWGHSSALLPMYCDGTSTHDFVSLASLWNTHCSKTKLSAQIEVAVEIPHWLTMEYIPTVSRWDMSGKRLHGAVAIVVHSSEESGSKMAPDQALIYSPHGLPSVSLERWLSPDVAVMAVMQSFQMSRNPIWLGDTITYGHDAALKICESLRTPLLIQTHDDVKEHSGFVSKLITIKRPHLDDVKILAKDKGIQVATVGVGETLELLPMSSTESCHKVTF